MIERDYVKFALDNYQAAYFDMDDFNSDLNKVIVLKKMFRRYTNAVDLNERLALNNIIIIINQFGVNAANTILFYKVEKEHHSILKTFLTYLNSYTGNDFVDPSTELDPNIIDKLKDITCRSCLA